MQTEDGGKTWFENVFTDDYYYVQGVGFVDENMGWLGGSNGYTMETRDGGKSWKKVTDIGRGFNKFQFFGDTLGYGTGFGVFKLEKPKSLPNGLQKDFHENGKLKSAVFYKNGLKNGMAKLYDENGQPTSKGNFKNNLQVGKWHFYENSKTNKIRYRNGIAKISKKTYDDFKGNYQVREGVDRIITLENGKLFSKISTSDRKFEIYPISDREFIYEDEPRIRVEFVKNELGKVTHHIMRNGRRESTATKK